MVCQALLCRYKLRAWERERKRERERKGEAHNFIILSLSLSFSLSLSPSLIDYRLLVGVGASADGDVVDV